MEYLISLNGQSLFHDYDANGSPSADSIYYLGTETDGKITSCKKHRTVGGIQKFAMRTDLPPQRELTREEIEACTRHFRAQPDVK